MPNLKNAIKALRQSEVRAERNKLILAEIDSMRTKMRKLVAAGKIDEAKALMNLLNQKLDKSVTKGINKKNTMARVKSRTMASLNAAAKAK